MGLLGGGYCMSAGLLGAAESSKSDAGRLQNYRNAAEKIRPLFAKKKEPQFGDWLDQKKEPGQTFAQYLASSPNTRTAERTRLYLQPIGGFTKAEEEVLAILREFCCMNGSNSLEESDRASMVFCCECDPKLWWSCNLEPIARARALAEFAKRNSLEREAAEWAGIATALGRS